MGKSVDEKSFEKLDSNNKFIGVKNIFNLDKYIHSIILYIINVNVVPASITQLAGTCIMINRRLGFELRTFHLLILKKVNSNYLIKKMLMY